MAKDKDKAAEAAAKAAAEAEEAAAKAAAAADEEAQAQAAAEAEDPNEGLDVFNPKDSLFISLPTSPVRAFLAKAEIFKIKGRTGKGACTCLKKFQLPNGDLILQDDTFDPVEERMNVMTYRSLLKRKYFTPGGQKVETKLLEIEAKKGEKKKTEEKK